MRRLILPLFVACSIMTLPIGAASPVVAKAVANIDEIAAVNMSPARFDDFWWR